MKNQKGFSLIELLIVVAVIGIIAAIAVPNLLESKKAANEASAISSIRTIVTAQITYSATIGNGSYAADLGALSTAGMVDSGVGDGTKDGYGITSAGTATGFTVNATPTSTSSGTRSFFSDETAVIRVATGGAASAASPPLGG